MAESSGNMKRAELLIAQLESISDGATIHTRNKARAYLRMFADDESLRGQTLFAVIAKQAEYAIRSQDFEGLRCAMLGLW